MKSLFFGIALVLTSCERVRHDTDTWGTRRATERIAYMQVKLQHYRQLHPLKIDFVALLAEASAHLSDAADPDPARVAAAHSAHAVKMAQYHMCLAER